MSKPLAIFNIKSHADKMYALNAMTQSEKELAIVYWIRSTMSPAARKKEEIYHIKEEKKIIKVLDSFNNFLFTQNIDNMNMFSMACFSRCYKIYSMLKERIDFGGVVQNKHIEDVAFANNYLAPKSQLFRKDLDPIIVDFFQDKKISDINKTKLYAHCWLHFYLKEGMYCKYCEMDVLTNKRNQLNDLVKGVNLDLNVFCQYLVVLGNLCNKNHLSSFYDSIDSAQYSGGISKELFSKRLLSYKNDLFKSKEFIRFEMDNMLITEAQKNQKSKMKL